MVKKFKKGIVKMLANNVISTKTYEQVKAEIAKYEKTIKLEKEIKKHYYM